MKVLGNESEGSRERKQREVCSVLQFASCEVLAGKYDHMADMWSLGVIMCPLFLRFL